MQRVGDSGQGQGHGIACVLVLGEYTAASWLVYRPAERVRCVTCAANEFPWPGKAVGRAY